MPFWSISSRLTRQHKIRDAAYRALCEVDHLHPIENKENLAERVANRLAFKYKNLHRAISVEEIQDDVENSISSRLTRQQLCIRWR